MDFKSTSFNGYIMEEVYVDQPSGFEDKDFPSHVYKLDKDLHGLQQASEVGMRDINFPVASGFNIGKVDTTLISKRKEKDFLVIRFYVDEIILVLLMSIFLY